jgi:acyl-CoA synthetase (AMP-forming)/AMP-acid ligase II
MSDPGADALAQFLKARLAPYQVPVRFLRLDDMPRAAQMKVSLPDLRALFEAEAAPSET